MTFPLIKIVPNQLWAEVVEYRLPSLGVFLEQHWDVDHVTKIDHPDASEQGRFSRARYRHRWSYGALETNWFSGSYEQCMDSSKPEERLYGFPVHEDGDTLFYYQFAHLRKDKKWERVIDWDSPEGAKHTNQSMAGFGSLLVNVPFRRKIVVRYHLDDSRTIPLIQYEQNPEFGPPLLMFDEFGRAVCAGISRSEPNDLPHKRTIFSPQTYTQDGRWSSTEYLYVFNEGDYAGLS